MPNPNQEGMQEPLFHAGGTYCHKVLMDYPRYSYLGNASWKIPGPYEISELGKSTSRLKYAQKQPILNSRCSPPKKLR